MDFYNEYIKIWYYFDTDKTAEDLLLYLEKYVNQCIVQMQRINQDQAEMRYACDNTELYSTEKRVAFGKYYCDIHFYIISVDKALKLARRLADHFSDDALKGILAKYELSDAIRPVRNSLEHMDERIVNTDCFRKDFSHQINKNLNLDEFPFTLRDDSLVSITSMYQEIIQRVNDILEPNKQRIDDIRRRMGVKDT
jgi:hypothetical protein